MSNQSLKLERFGQPAGERVGGNERRPAGQAKVERERKPGFPVRRIPAILRTPFVWAILSVAAPLKAAWSSYKPALCKPVPSIQRSGRFLHNRFIRRPKEEPKKKLALEALAAESALITTCPPRQF